MTPFQSEPFNFANYEEYFEDSYGALAIVDPPVEPYNRGNIPYDSRLLGADHFQSLNITAALAGTGGRYGIMLHAPGKSVGKGIDTSDNPGWRKAAGFVVGWKANGLNVDRLRELAPDMGTYINEVIMSDSSILS